MLPTSLAFAWMFWRRHRWAILLVLGYLLVATALSAVLPAHLAPEAAPAGFGLLTAPTIYLAMFLLGMFCLGWDMPIGGRQSCFPADLFLLPVRTGTLAAWPMAYGAATASLLWLVLAWCIMRPWTSLWSVWVPLWWPALFATAALAWIQALLWLPFGLRGLRVVVMFLLILGLVALAQYGALSGVSEPILVGLFSGLAVLGWTLGYLGVRQGRRGDAPNWEGLFEPWRRLVRRLPHRRPAEGGFATAGWAQSWFEWRRTGNSLPIMTGLTLPFVLCLPVVFCLILGANVNDFISPAQTVLIALALPVVTAGMAGMSVRDKNRWVKDHYGLPASTATLPMSTGEMVGAKLKAAALSTLAAWALVVVAVPPAMILTGNLETVLGWWRQAQQQEVPALKIVAGLMAATILLVGCTWKRLVDSLFIGLTGRQWVIAGALLGAMVVYIGLGFVGSWIYHNPETHELLLALVPWLLSLLLACRLSVAGLALRAGLRRRVLAPRTAVRWVTAWVCVAATLFGFLAYAVPAERVPVYNLAFAVLFAMPMARLTAAPLALAWNRHR
jgi:hypothetical protein